MILIHYQKIILKALAFCVLVSCGQSNKNTAQEPISDDSNDLVLARELLENQKSLVGSYIVALRPKESNPNKGFYFESFRDELRFHQGQINLLLNKNGQKIKDYSLIGTVDLNGQLDLDKKYTIEFPLDLSKRQEVLQPQLAVLARLDFASEEDAEELLVEWKNNQEIWFAEPNYVSEINSCGWTEASPKNLFETCHDFYIDNVPSSSSVRTVQNSVRLYEALLALNNRTIVNGINDDLTLINQRPIVAVLDSGVDINHPALNGYIWQNNNSNIGEAGCVNDLNGCNTSVAKKDKLGDGNVYPATLTGHGQSCSGLGTNCPHGTAVSSIIAADVSAGSAVGICPVCRIMPIKIVGPVPGQDKEGILDSSILAGLKYISRFDSSRGDSAVRVVNASFGKYSKSKAVGVYINILFDKRNAVIIGAAGNEDSSRMTYIAGFDKAIAVSALDQTLNFVKAEFSNFGTWVDIAAPGQAIPLAEPGGEYKSAGGTSFAAPIVAGIAGLLVAQNPLITSSEIRELLLSTANPDIYSGGPINELYAPKITGNSTRTPLLGRGIVSAEHAVKKIINTNQLSSGPSYDRVEPFCGSIGVAHKKNHIEIVVVLFLLLPFLLLFLTRTKNIK